MASASPFAYEGAQVLLVEGINEGHVISALCQAHHVPETFGLYACGSDDKVLKRLNALILQPEAPKTIGIVLDADQGIERRWDSVRNKLRNYRYNFPSTPDVGGTIVDSVEGFPKLGVWLMPNNQSQGMLEDFCLTMIDAQVQLYVTDTVVNAQTAGACTFKSPHFPKAVVHTYLAWQDEPGTPLGLSITRQSLKPHTTTALAFTQWLTRLF
ncbi:MAG: DUF3226 domain-containing protein [Caldilineaceae bacterium]